MLATVVNGLCNYLERLLTNYVCSGSTGYSAFAASPLAAQGLPHWQIAKPGNRRSRLERGKPRKQEAPWPAREPRNDQGRGCCSQPRPGVIPGAGTACEGCPSGQSKLHREAPQRAIDPETALCGLYASTQEGGWRHIPANLPPTVKLRVFVMRPRSLASDGRE